MWGRSILWRHAKGGLTPMLDTHIGAVDGFDNGHQKAHVQGIEIVPLVNYWQ